MSRHLARNPKMGETFFDHFQADLNRPPTLQTLTLAYNDILPSGDFILHHHRLGMHIVLLSLSLLFDILLLLINLCRSCSSFSTILRLCIELCNYISVKS